MLMSLGSGPSVAIKHDVSVTCSTSDAVRKRHVQPTFDWRRDARMPRYSTAML